MATVRMTDQRGHSRYTLPVYRIDVTTTDRCMDGIAMMQPRTERIIHERQRRAKREQDTL